MAKYKIIPSSRTIVHSPISIGHKAEKGVEAIEFDLTAWVETYGSGALTVIMRRWGDAIPYPIALEIGEDNKATWVLSDTDTAKAGMAYAQLNYIVGDEVVKKSDIYTFRVMDSLTGEGEPPEAYESWLEHLTHLAAEAMAEVLDIEGIVTDKTLTVDGGIADGKATGDALALKADKLTTYTKAEVDQMIEDVEVETDTTLEVSGAPADAAETGRQIGLLKADLGDISGYTSHSFTDGGFITTSVSPVDINNIHNNNVISYCVIPCLEGDTFTITGTGGSTGRLWAFIDTSGNILSSETYASVQFTNLRLVAPANTAYLVANARTDSPRMLLSGERAFLNNEDARIIYGEIELHPNMYPTIGYTINSNNKWQTSAYVKCAIVPVSKNIEYTFTNNNADDTYIAFLKDGWYSNSVTPHFATGVNGRVIIPASGGEYRAVTPEDAEVVVVQLIDNRSRNVMPKIMVKEVASTAKTIADNMMWSWWVYPTMQSFTRVRDKLYWTFTTATGDSGIASYDYRSKNIKNTVLKHTDTVDDHSGIAMKVLASGKILCAYSTGHNDDGFMHVRLSKIAEDISEFEESIDLESNVTGNTTYSQLFTYAATGQTGKIYLFYRAGSGHTWACRISADYGATWGEEIPIITSADQYYCCFRETTTRGVLRICMMSNPNANDRSIRQAFLHLSTMEVYDSDNTTLLGTTNVDCTRVSALIGLTSGYDTQRLFDVAITDIGAPKILYAPFNLSQSSDSVYKLYNNGATITICNGGMSLWNPKYQLGACFKGTNEILVARNDNGVDCIEKYDDTGVLKNTYYRELVTNNIRNFRPVCDVNGRAWAYLRGYYNPNNFKDFNADAILMAYN